MRLFLAIELPQGFRDHLVRVQHALRSTLPEASMTKPDNLHVTLKFLGEVDPQRQDNLCESLGMITASPIDLVADRIECFPPRGPIRVVAAGMTGAIKALAHIHASIEQRCHFLGFERESRSYSPHVTLARAKRPLKPTARELAAQTTAPLWPGPNFIVNEIVLMQSRLKPQGAEYTIAARFPFSVAPEKFS
jgi:2'-5' RNA ligase